MTTAGLRITYIGGPTALLELNGLRLLTDPTFDAAGTEYSTGLYTLRKTSGPAVRAEELGPLDAVLLSHDHHFDNLDNIGRSVLNRAKTVLTTTVGAKRLGGSAIGLVPWQTVEVLNDDQRGKVRVTATPARHGPADGDRGPVTGFVLVSDEPHHAVYISGDTVWCQGVAEIARRFPIRVAVLFMGAARVREVGPHHLTFTAAEGVEVARAFADATIVPVHFEGWAHFSESAAEIQTVFAGAHLKHRLRLLTPGVATEFPSI